MISVIMATYNGADFLLPQLESIRKQTVVPDEVVFLDDVSSDSTISIIENYIDMYQLKNWFVFRNSFTRRRTHTTMPYPNVCGRSVNVSYFRAPNLPNKVR